MCLYARTPPAPLTRLLNSAQPRAVTVQTINAFRPEYRICVYTLAGDTFFGTKIDDKNTFGKYENLCEQSVRGRGRPMFVCIYSYHLFSCTRIE